MTSGRRERSSPSLSTLCGHPRPCSTTPRTAATTQVLLERTGAGRRHTCRCTSYGPPSTAPSSLFADDDRTVNHYATNLEAAPVRAQDAPRRHDWIEIRQDGRQLHGTARHAFTRRRIVRHACKSLPPWPIKGRAIPHPQGGRHEDNNTRRRTANTRTLSAFATILALASINTSGTWRPGLLSLHACSPLYEHHGATQYSASSTPLLDVRPRPEPG
jgi:hypothetical protein